MPRLLLKQRNSKDKLGAPNRVQQTHTPLKPKQPEQGNSPDSALADPISPQNPWPRYLNAEELSTEISVPPFAKGGIGGILSTEDSPLESKIPLNPPLSKREAVNSTALPRYLPSRPGANTGFNLPTSDALPIQPSNDHGLKSAEANTKGIEPNKPAAPEPLGAKLLPDNQLNPADGEGEKTIPQIASAVSTTANASVKAGTNISDTSKASKNPATESTQSKKGAATGEKADAPKAEQDNAHLNAKSASIDTTSANQSTATDEETIIDAGDSEAESVATDDTLAADSLNSIEPLNGSLPQPRFDAAFELASGPLQRVTRNPNGAVNDEGRKAVSFALEQYGQTARLAKTVHDKALSLASTVEHSIFQSYQKRTTQVVQFAESLNSRIDSETDAKLDELDVGKQSALRIIDGQFAEAASGLNNSAGSGYSKLRANAKEAEAQKPTVLKKIEQKRAQPFEKNKTRYQEEADKGTKTLQTWPDTFSKEVAGKSKSTKLEAAKNEAKQAQIKRSQPHKIRKLSGLIKATIAGEEGRKLSNWATEGPTYSQKIDARRASILKDGIGAVTNSLHQSMNSLNGQVKQARQSLLHMHQSGKAQLNAQRRVAHAQTIQQANGVLNALHKEAQAALRSLASTQSSAIPMYARSVSRLSETMNRAAEGGPTVLENAARSSPKEVNRASDQAFIMQSDRLKQMQVGIERGLDQRVLGFEAASGVRVDSTAEKLAVSVATLIEQLSAAAESGSRGFGNMTGSVAHAADRWLEPLAAAFKQDIESVEQKGDPKAATPTAPNAGGADKQEKSPEDVANLLQFVGVAQNPGEAFKSVLDQAGETIRTKLNQRAGDLRGQLNKGIFGPDVAATLKPLHGITATQGSAMYELYQGSLDKDLGNLSAADRLKAELYLQGNAKEAARQEVNDSIGIFTDDEQRIKDVTRELPPDAAAELANDKDWAKTAGIVRDSLSGSDLAIFEARLAGESDKADMLEMKEEIDAARENDDKDAFNASLEKYSTAKAEDVEGLDPEEREQLDAERRGKIQKEFAKLPGMADLAGKGASDADILLAYATRTIVKPQYGGGEGPPPPPIELKVEGAQKDRAEALIKHGPNSVEAKTAALAVEIQRPGGADPEKVDKASVDPRLNPNNYPPDFVVPPKVAEAAKKDREAILLRFAQKYGNANEAASVETAKQFVNQQLKASLANQKPYVQEAAVELLNTGHPTPAVAAKELRFAIEGLGTNVPLIKTTLGRMNRDEIAKLREAYTKETNGRDLYDDLGVFGHGTLGDLSGDDRLQVQILLQGTPRNDKERAEVAEFSRQQQEKETGDLGKALASDSAQEGDLKNAGENLKKLTGAELTFGADGEPIWNPAQPKMFGAKGEYTGKNAEQFKLAVQNAEIAAQNYAAKIDSYADAAVTVVAVIGAVAAAVATVLTGGAASPLLIAAIAGVTGLASMGMHRWISGGRYGWEQATVDLGMTAVQMLTAGVGAQLGAVSRGGMVAVKEAAAKGVALEMGKITGNAVMDMMVIGAATGAISGLGQSALSEETWKKGFEHAFASMLEGTFRGMLSGAATAAASQAVEHLPTGGKLNLGSRMGQSTSMVGRGVMKAASNGVGAFAGRGAEIGFDAGLGKFKGDAGDALLQMAAAGGHVAVQGFGEGAAEAPAQRIHNAKQQAKLQAQTTKSTPAEAEMHGKTVIPHTEATTQASHVNEAVPHPSGDTPGSVKPVEHAEHTGKTSAPTNEEITAPKTPIIEPTAVSTASKPLGEPLPQAGQVTRPSGEGPVVAEASSSARGARTLQEGEAAHVIGSSFNAGGAAKIDEPAVRQAIGEALPHLKTDGGIHIENDTPVVTLKLEGKGEIKVRIETEMPPADRKLARTKPVAGFQENPDGSYTVKVSAGSKPEHVERALAHELAEIRHLEAGGRSEGPYALAAGSKAAELSAHDVGRIAELEVIARQIAESSANPDAVANLRAEAEALVSHLGLVHGGDAAQRRLALLDPHLAANPSLKSMVAESIEGAKARNLPPPAGDLKQDEYTNLINMDRTRQRYADYENFQEWGEFKVQYQGKNPRSGLSDQELFNLWTSGRYVSEEGTTRSLKSDETRRTPGVKASLGETIPHAAHIDEAHARPLLADRDAALTQQKTLREQADHHQAKGNIAEAENLRKQADALQGKVNEPTRQLGEAAAEAYVKSRPDAAELTPVPMPKQGSGVPDQVYKTADGRLVIIEAKGGKSPLGMREGVGSSKGLLVEQGTRQYLESLAHELTRPNAPDNQKALGKLIKEALAKPNGVEYLLLRQPIETTQTGSSKTSQLGQVEVQAFDLSAKPKVPTQTATTPSKGVPPSSIGIETSASVKPGTSNAVDSVSSSKAPTAMDSSKPVTTGSESTAHDLATPSKTPSDNPEGTRLTADQAAAGISGSRLDGEAAKRFGLAEASINRVMSAAEHLASSGGALEGHVRISESLDGSNTFTILGRSANEPEIPVRFIVVEELPRVKGVMKAAQYEKDDAIPGGYVVKITRGTPASELPRALAHELTEIRAVYGTDGKQVDALGSGGTGTRLSPHDQGRLAELNVMARQIAALDPNHAETPATRMRLLDESQRLIEHLGLLGDNETTNRRLVIARKALPETTPVRALFEEALRTASDNPFLQRPSGKVEEDLALFARRLEHVRSLGESQQTLNIREAEIIEQAAKAVMRDRLVVTLVSKKKDNEGMILASPDAIRIANLRSKLAPGQQALLDRAIVQARNSPPLLVDESAKPSPGYEAKYKTPPSPRSELDLSSDQPVTLKYKDKPFEQITVEEAVVRRRGLLEQQRTKREAMAELGISDAARLKLKGDFDSLTSTINKLSEALGTAAGRRFIENHPELSKGKIIEFPHEGAGLPDLMVELPPSPGGSLVLVECKGGDAKLGTRQSADKRLRIQQGRREYLESLSQKMGQSEDLVIKKYGEQLRKQLANQGQETRYFLVRQPFDITESPTSPEVGQFDIP